MKCRKCYNLELALLDHLVTAKPEDEWLMRIYYRVFFMGKKFYHRRAMICEICGQSIDNKPVQLAIPSKGKESKWRMIRI